MEYPYISVYTPNEKDFSHNGLRILMPSECTITEALNGEYSLSISHPLDKWGTWRYIREHYIVKAQGQLFRIYRKTLSMSSDGSYEIKADAMHIFYDLNSYFIKSTRPMLATGEYALNWITTPKHNDYQNILNDDPRKRFTFSTDIKPAGQFPEASDLKTAYYEKMSVTEALIGADNCFVKVWGGEMLRDNFNVSINKRLGKDNAFLVSYGVDMTEIEQEIDCTDLCEALYYEATVFNETIADNKKERTETIVTGTVTVENTEEILPVKPMQLYEFEVNLNDIKCTGTLPTLAEIQSGCEARAKAYLLEKCQPTYNYRVKFADLKNYEKYKDFIGLQKCNLGDTGTIYHTELGINTVQQIVKKTIDGLTGETLSVELGSIRKTLTSELAKRR